MTTATLDARNLLCPLPILKTKKALNGVAPGGMLEVLATDANTSADMKAFVAARGHELISEEERDGEWRFLLRRGTR